MDRKLFSTSGPAAAGRVLCAGFCAVMLFATVSPAQAQAIEALLLEEVPVPVKRPAPVTIPAPTIAAFPAVALPAPDSAQLATSPVAIGPPSVVGAERGSLREGLDALTAGKTGKAMAIRAGLPSGSVAYKTLGWALALSGQSGLKSADVARIAAELPGWPGQEAMRRNAEGALAREDHPPRQVIAAFEGRQPETLAGATVLAKAYLYEGDTGAARRVIAPFWHDENLSEAEERRILATVGAALLRVDHRIRMHKQFYRERSAAGMRMGGLAEQYSLAKARAAVIRDDRNADALLDAVEPSSKQDVGYLFARIKRVRRLGDYQAAAKLMLGAPRDPALLIDPDEWWIERKLISRNLLDLGDARTAYKIAADHSAQSPADQAEAEFHAGWYALRFLGDNATARGHFERLAAVTSTPISQARAYYWLGRASSGQDAERHFRRAAEHDGSFYGQLAAQRLGIRRLDIRKTEPSAAERDNFARNEAARAIALLEEAGYNWRAEALYRGLAQNLDSPGELAILAARAENQGKHSLALQIGKIGHSRGLDVDSVSWPVGAIPAGAKISGAGKALAYAIARQESAFNAAAISPAKARGLLQLLPGTAKDMARKLGVAYSTGKLTTDPAYNASLGAAYLSEQLDNFSNSYILTFVGYNAGPGRARQWVEAYGDPRGRPVEEVIDWVERIPFTETRNYVQRVMENYQVYKTRLTQAHLDIEGDLRVGRR
jgi:soluble lytic murein transglycosylase